MKMFAQAVFAPHPPLPTVHLQVLVKFNGNGEDDHDDDNDDDDDDDGHRWRLAPASCSWIVSFELGFP